jgi:myotubularin-related protein 6/7/8
MISLVTRMPMNADSFYPVLIHTRNFRSYTLKFSQGTDSLDAFESIRALTVAGGSCLALPTIVPSADTLSTATVTQLYAFFYSPSERSFQSNGWEIYSSRTEFARMGIGSRTKAWRFTDINKNYKVGNANGETAEWTRIFK